MMTNPPPFPVNFVLPGDELPLPLPLPAPGSKNTAIKIGPGLAHIPPDAIVPVTAGELNVDEKKRMIWVEGDGKRVGKKTAHQLPLLPSSSSSHLEFFGLTFQKKKKKKKYTPHLHDPVIAVINRSSADFYHCTIPNSRSTAALLPHLAFENATKKTRPNLSAGTAVYARISLASKHMDPELECSDPATGKSHGYGELKGGMLFDVSLGMARRLLGDGKKLRHLKIRNGEVRSVGGGGGGGSGGGRGGDDGKMSTGLEVIEELSQRFGFEIAVGRNGKVWVDSEDVRTTLCVGRCIVQGQFLTGEDQRRLVRAKIKELGL